MREICLFGWNIQEPITCRRSTPIMNADKIKTKRLRLDIGWRQKRKANVQLSKTQIEALTDEQLSELALEDDAEYADDILLALWEEIATRGLSVDLADQPPDALGEAPPEDLVTVATFRNHVEANFALTRLRASGIQAFLFDDNAIRIDWFLATALGGIKLRVPAGDVADSMEILGSRDA
jgi:hypothetical protein